MLSSKIVVCLTVLFIAVWCTDFTDGCVDRDPVNCPWYAAYGNCTNETWKSWMQTNCQKSCFLCEAPCEDSNSTCPTWATTNGCYCWDNSAWNNVHCKKSCEVCTGACNDRHDDCSGWAEQGECYNNPNWMFIYCRRSCNLCKSDNTRQNIGLQIGKK